MAGASLWAAIAAALFLGAWVCLDHGWYAHGRIVDTPIYQGYGLQMRNGLLPYRDFSVEYPPGALPVFVAPTYFGQPTVPSDYQRWFARLMAACGLACLAFVLLSRPSRPAIIFVALSPLLVGQVMLSRFDLWPAAFVAAAVAAFLHDRHRLGWLALALAFVAKLYAVVLIPLAILWTLRRRGRGELVKGIAIWLVAVAAVFAPFAIVAPHGLWDGIWGQFSRPIQVESLVASLLTTFGSPHDAVSHNSVGIVGYGWLAALTTMVELACLVALWIGFARGPAERGSFRALRGRVRRGLRRVREGALTAVPDLARAARPARAGPPRARRLGAARARHAGDAVLVHVGTLCRRTSAATGTRRSC